MTSDGWGGRRVTRAREVVRSWLPAPCGKCGQEVTAADEFNVGHVRSRAAYPELMWVVSNWQPEHRGCSDSSGVDAVREKAHREGVRAVLDHPRLAAMRSTLEDLDGALFPLDAVSREASGLPLPLPWARPQQAAPVTARDALTWDDDALRDHAWTADLADVPSDASPPLWMSPVPDDAVCSYGWAGCTHLPDGVPDAVTHIEAVERKRLRWWQTLATVRQLEHRDDGTLVHRNVLESAPRRAGKSVRLRGLSTWRMRYGLEVFGEVQTVMHTGSDVAICREIQRGAWRWAEDTAGWVVSKANGKEAIEAHDGSRWMVRAQTAVYGYDVTLALGDECWDVDPGTISEGLEPAMLERHSPQLHLTSTAHRRASSLMRGRLSAALATDDGETLLLVWAAVAGSDPADPTTWRAASPHWTEDRRKMIAAKYLAAEAGQVDPQADDPDPMAGFTAQYLNIWRLTARASLAGSPLVEEDQWLELVALPDDRAPDAAAIESHFGRGTSLALAWREAGAAVVSATDHRDLKSAVAELRRTGFRGKVIVGASLADDPALLRVPRTPTKARLAAAADDLGRLLTEGVLQHDGSAHLAGQVLEIRTAPGTDGPRILSRGRADAVKAVAWAATAARSRPRATGGIVLPTGV